MHKLKLQFQLVTSFKGDNGKGIVENVIFIGAPVPADPIRWSKYVIFLFKVTVIQNPRSCCWQSCQLL